MATLRRFLLRLLNAVRSSRAESDLAREMASHLTLLEDEFRRRGMSREDARTTARRAIGGVEQTKDRQRDARSFVWVDGAIRDVRLAIRSARRRPGFTLLVVLTLGLGLGASAAAFDALDRTLLRPLPFSDANRLVYVSLRDVRRDIRTPPEIETLAIWRQRAKSLDGLEIYRRGLVVWQTPSGAQPRDCLAVSGGLLEMLRVRPLAGRLLEPADAAAGAPPVAMVTEQAWRDLFGTDAHLVGRVLLLGQNPRPTALVGILPAGARIDSTLVPDFLTVLPEGREYPRGASAMILARMRAGIRPEAAAAELRAITPPRSSDLSAGVPDVSTPAALALGSTFARDVWLVFAGALALFAISIVNAGHLLLGRAAAREHELAVRRALGGSSLRLARLFVAEAAVCVGCGLALGVGVMVALERLIRHYESRLFMDLQGAGLEGRSVWFLGAGAAMALAACALMPLLRPRLQDQGTRIGAGSAARSTMRASRMMSAFNVIQAAIAVLLVVGAAVMARSFARVMAVDSGMAIDHLVSLGASPPATRYSTPAKRAAYRQQVKGALETIPTVSGVTTSYSPLLETSRENGMLTLDNEPQPPAEGATFGLARVPRNYFEVTGTRVIAGRSFRPDDLPDVAIVNQTFAMSRGGPVVGHLVYTPIDSRPFRIVGVVSDVKSFGIADTNTRYQLYVFQPRSNTAMYVRFFIRTSGDPALVIREARRRIAAIDPAIAVQEPETGIDVIRRQTSPFRFAAVILSGLAVLGLALALAGIYGSVALGVSRRTREIGIRIALGSTPRRVMLTVVGTALRPVLVGGIAGVGGAWLALPYVQALLYHVHSNDPWSSAAGVSVVAAAAAAAACIPAWRASRIDPVTALRRE